MEGVRISRATGWGLSVMSWEACLSKGNASLTVSPLKEGRQLQGLAYTMSHTLLWFQTGWPCPHSPQTRGGSKLLLPGCSTTSRHNSGTRLPQDPWDKDRGWGPNVFLLLAFPDQCLQCPPCPSHDFPTLLAELRTPPCFSSPLERCPVT